METFEVRLWDREEHWFFDVTVEADDTAGAYRILKRDYPPSRYKVAECRKVI